jgi:hypothetical protein
VCSTVWLIARHLMGDMSLLLILLFAISNIETDCEYQSLG